MKQLFSFWQLACVAVLTVVNLMIGLDYGSYYRSAMVSVGMSSSSSSSSSSAHVGTVVDNVAQMMDLPNHHVVVHGLQSNTREGCTIRSIPINANMTLENVQLPLWIKEYFAWHSQRLFVIERDNLPWTEEKVLLSRCYHTDNCGGTADRLREFHNLIALAARTRRLLFFVWTRPMALEEFLQPGPLLNWTLPNGLQTVLRQRGNYSAYRSRESLEDATADPEQWVVEAALQSGSDRTFREVNQERGHKDDADLFLKDGFHNLWWSVFTPSPPLLTLLDKLMEHLDLYPNQFVFAHYRAAYPGEAFLKTGDAQVLQDTTINAIHCALSTVDSQYPVYIASDNIQALDVARKYSQQSGVRIVTHLDLPRNTADFAFLTHDSNPPHLNFVDSSDASVFYPVFLDLLTFSLSRGASYGSGGFGRLGSRISYNFSGFVEHSHRGKAKYCKSPVASG